MDFLPQLFAIFLVFAVLGLLLWVLKHGNLARFVISHGSAGKGRLMECAESMALTPQHSVHLIKIANRAILVSSQSSGCTLLGNFPWEEMEAGGKRGRS